MGLFLKGASLHERRETGDFIEVYLGKCTGSRLESLSTLCKCLRYLNWKHFRDP